MTVAVGAVVSAVVVAAVGLVAAVTAVPVAAVAAVVVAAVVVAAVAAVVSDAAVASVACPRNICRDRRDRRDASRLAVVGPRPEAFSRLASAACSGIPAVAAPSRAVAHRQWHPGNVEN